MDRLELEGNWSLRRLADGSERPIRIPGDIISALLATGEIPDPYYDRNELELQWIGREDWLLEREIDLSPELLARERVFLDLDVVDTLAEISVNGTSLGASSNMFTAFRADAKPLLKAGRNHIAVLLRSPERAAARAALELPYPIPYSEFPISSPHRNLIRKAQCMSGWDWGPCLMTGGIYDGASLLGLDGPRIDYVAATATREGERWSLDVTAWLDSPGPRDIRLSAAIAGAEASRSLRIPAGRSTARLRLEPSGVAAWWPAGYGEQPLYDLVVRVSGEAASGPSLHERRERFGFRELEVAAEEDEAGRSLVFRVNGRDVFCKGANWIPADALPARWTRERLDDLLSSAVSANMNCIRVWGGGRYESDEFYELCDEKGLLVWQDCAFSCSLYPADPAFLAQAEAEIRHQVLRLRDHPSLALWCGNNENLGALGWYPESKQNPMRYIVDYDRLYEGTLGRIVKELDPGRAWWPSSPSGGPSDFADNWHGDGRGDMHFWSVWHEGKSFAEYLAVKPRFCSEFGFQSYPSHRTVASFAPEGERNVTGPAMEHHQRHKRGNTIILETMSRYFRMPSGARETLYLSQVQQAWAIRTAVDYWRSLRPLCMGALYWQLNDLWPVSSWSSLDYDGGWKLLHYEARRFFEPLHLALILKDGALVVQTVNDGLEGYEGSLTTRLRRLDGSTAAEYRVDARVGPESSTRLYALESAALPASPEEIFVEAALELKAASGGAKAGTIETRTAVAFLTEPKRCSLPDPRIEANAVEGRAGPELLLRCERPAFYVACEASGGRFEDSGFHLMPGTERRLRFVPSRGAAMPSLDELGRSLHITHLRASYE